MIMEIMKVNSYNVIHLTDGAMIGESTRIVNKGDADGINFHFIKNIPKTIDEIKSAVALKYIQINDYSGDFDYSAINFMHELEDLSIYTRDRKEINFLNFPQLRSVAIDWRERAKSIFDVGNLERLFLGSYTGKDLQKLEKLTNLKWLRINMGSVQSLNGAEKLTKLETLFLMQATKLEDISGIEKLPNLRHLIIDNCKNIKNIDMTSRLYSLKSLEIVGTTPKISSINGR